VSQHSTTVSHNPQSWQYPPQQQPLHASAPTTDLVPHLRRELSTYVDHRIVQATAPLQQEVDTLRADKEALTALVAATSTAFTTLDARLLEERRLREAAEHQQSEDQRKLTEAQDRLQTTITQQGTHQEAMAERLPIIESSLRTLMQAMQSVSSQLAGLAALGNPATRLPAAYPAQTTLTPSTSAPDARIQRDNVLRRETLEGEAYIGDAGSTPTLDMQVDSLRIAATNINKNTYGKLSAELATWFRANALDFLIIADSDLPAYKATQLWTPAHGGTHAPSLMAVSNHRVSLLYDIQRWHSRIDARCTIYSPSGRSIAITLRLGKGTLVTLIGTYCQDNPAAHKEATDREWQWLAQAATRATGPHHFVVMGGDFNTYGPNPLDRLAPTPRASPSNDIGIAFQQWTQGIGLVSSFRHRHPNLQRHTYARNNTSVALDDIYISARTAHKVGASGIWLHTIHSSDHEGTPYMALDLCPGDHTPTRLTGVKPIRVVNTRNLAKADIASFGVHTSQLLSEGKLPQLTPAPPPNAVTAWSPQEIGDWLDGAIRNLYDILYNSAKLKWGETSQTRKALNRAVAIQRTNRCTAQLRQLLRLHEAAPRTGTEYNRLAHLVEWPKWIRDPNLLPP
ncbi:hypothetical protein DYB26_015331, partial [Aphanomyces astaci]